MTFLNAPIKNVIGKFWNCYFKVYFFVTDRELDKVFVDINFFCIFLQKVFLSILQTKRLKSAPIQFLYGFLRSKLILKFVFLIISVKLNTEIWNLSMTYSFNRAFRWCPFFWFCTILWHETCTTNVYDHLIYNQAV